MDTKKTWIEPSKKDILKARLKIVGWITVHLIATNQENKIVEIFKHRGIFLSHAKYIAEWKQDKDNQIFEKKIHNEILDEVERFLESRK